MEVATFWQIGEKRVCTGGHESDGYPCSLSFHFAFYAIFNIKFFLLKSAPSTTYGRWFRQIVDRDSGNLYPI